MQAPTTWRELLGKIIQDSQERQRIANELGVNTITLSRWVSGESKPREQNLRQLLNSLPQQRGQMLELIVEEFPGMATFAQDGAIEDLSQEIPSEFYTRILNTYATSSKEHQFWSISNLILQQALGQLDPNHVGMAINIVLCMPPSPGHKIRSLREYAGRGTPPWPLSLEQRAIFLGAESLAGYAVTSCHPIFIQDSNEGGVFPAHWVEYEKSAAAFPIMRLDTTAGCLLVSSTQPEYFIPARRVLLQNYATLMLLAFSLEQLYSTHDLDLQPMPHYRTQEKHIFDFRKRVSKLMLEATQKKQPISIFEAERLVWQQLEEELLALPPYMGDEM